MKPLLTYIYRKKVSFFSIEIIFNLVVREIGTLLLYRTMEITLPCNGMTPKTMWRNSRIAGKLRSDIFHITGDVHYMALFLPAAKTILTIHDCVFMYQVHGIKKWLLQRWLLTWPVDRCRFITTISEQTKKDILRFTNCREDKIVVIPNPVNEKIPYIPRPFNHRKPVLLFIGTTPNKNLNRVITAIRNIPCVLEIVGRLPDGDLRDLDGSGIEYVNTFDLSGPEMIEKYIQADIILFPSTFEGFGMPVIEGQKAGRAVITSDLSPMREVAAGAACLVDPFDTDAIKNGILAVIGDDAYREDLIRKGLENVARFGIKEISLQYNELYAQIIKGTECVE